MPTTLTQILDAQGQQLTMTDLLATIEREERGGECEVEEICHSAQNISGNYRCGWRNAGTVGWCAKRRRYLSHQQMEVTK